MDNDYIIINFRSGFQRLQRTNFFAIRIKNQQLLFTKSDQTNFMPGTKFEVRSTAGQFEIGSDRPVDYIADSKRAILNFKILSKVVSCYMDTEF